MYSGITRSETGAFSDECGYVRAVMKASVDACAYAVEESPAMTAGRRDGSGAALIAVARDATMQGAHRGLTGFTGISHGIPASGIFAAETNHGPSPRI